MSHAHCSTAACLSGINVDLMLVVIGGVWGTLVGVFIIRVVDAGLVYLDVPSNAKEIVIGVIIVLAWPLM